MKGHLAHKPHKYIEDEELKGMIDLRWNWVKELQDSNNIKAIKVHTADNISDILTKCHGKIIYNRLLDLVDTKANKIAEEIP